MRLDHFSLGDHDSWAVEIIIIQLPHKTKNDKGMMWMIGFITLYNASVDSSMIELVYSAIDS